MYLDTEPVKSTTENMRCIVLAAFLFWLFSF